MNTSQQAAFFNKAPTFYPLRNFLAERGFSLVFRPRDIAWKYAFKSMDFKKGQKVLEIGCGTGVTLSRVYKSYAVKGVGVDVASTSIATAKKLFGKNLSFHVADATKLPFKNNMFDAVYSLDVLEHIQQQEKTVLEMERVLKKGGKLLIYTINKKQRFTFNWWLSKIGIDVYDAFAHDPKLFLDASRIKKILQKKEMIDFKIFYYDAFFMLFVNAVLTWLFMFLVRKSKSMIPISFYVITGISYAAYPFLVVLDLPWTLLHYSNSFFLFAKKR